MTDRRVATAIAPCSTGWPTEWRRQIGGRPTVVVVVGGYYGGSSVRPRTRDRPIATATVRHRRRDCSHQSVRYSIDVRRCRFRRELFDVQRILLRPEPVVASMILTMERRLISELIEVYKSCTCLWRIKDPDYKNKEMKNEAYESLLQLITKYNIDVL